jgi:hypothetical protein
MASPPEGDGSSSVENDGSGWSEPPWSGWIETTGDALLILEAARRGLIPRVTRRLVDSERKMITSGSVFVFDEDESGIKRWTDGFVWSPSRILGNFLVVYFSHTGDSRVLICTSCTEKSIKEASTVRKLIKNPRSHRTQTRLARVNRVRLKRSLKGWTSIENDFYSVV